MTTTPETTEIQTISSDPLQVAALQYCAGGTAADTLPGVLAMVTRAAGDGASLVCLPEAASFREALEGIGGLRAKGCRRRVEQLAS